MKKYLLIGCLFFMFIGNSFGVVEWQKKYQIANSDESSSVSYYGYTSREDTSIYFLKKTVVGAETSYEYSCGFNADYFDSWDDRVVLNYFTTQDSWKNQNLIENI